MYFGNGRCYGNETNAIIIFDYPYKPTPKNYPLVYLGNGNNYADKANGVVLGHPVYYQEFLTIPRTHPENPLSAYLGNGKSYQDETNGITFGTRLTTPRNPPLKYYIIIISI